MTCLSVSCWLLFVIGCGPSNVGPAAPPPARPGTTDTTASRELTVAAAADLKFVLGEMIQAFESEHPGVKVQVTYGASGTLYSQIVNHAPFDLYLSADVSYPQKLIEQGLAIQSSLFKYALGRIVIWLPNSSSLDLESQGILALKDSSIRKIALANPKHAPYGRAAEAALKQLGVYEELADRLVLGENVAQAVQFVESGAADAGLIALSLTTSTAMRDQGRYWIFPQSAYPPLEQAGVIISWAKEPAIAGQFRLFLQGEPCQAMFQSHGFELPTKE